MKWKTSISGHKNGELVVRGEKLADLIAGATFTECVFLILRGIKPKKNERAMLDAILAACIEHGAEVPSAFVPRVVASTGNPINAALAAGVLSIGDHHGGAGEAAMRMMQSGKIPDEKIPGLGHKIYKDEDPRAKLLLSIAKKLRVGGGAAGGIYQKLILKIQRDFEAQTGKHLPINVDGAIAAILLDMGFDWRTGRALFILGRMPGMVAHTIEEMMNEKPFRRFDEGDIEYIEEN